ncbi:CARDB domain-containing protein [Candidatus Latescibacterota bacterium]
MNSSGILTKKFILALFLLSAVTVFSAEKPRPVVNYHLSFESESFFLDDFIEKSGKKSVKQRQIEFPEGKFGKGILMNFIPQVPDDDNMSGIDLDLITAVIFNTSNFSEMGFNEPFFWGAGKLHPRLGAVAFWAKGKPAFPGPLFEQSSIAFGRLERDLIGIVIDDDNYLTAYLRDARYIKHELLGDRQWEPEKWNHIVFNWDWANGLELWLNGEKIAASWGNDSWFETMIPGLMHFPAAGIIYDEFYMLDRPLRKDEITKLMESNMAPRQETPSIRRSTNDLKRIDECSGADEFGNYPVISPDRGLKITEVWPVDARDENIPGWYVIDGRNEMAWPHEYAFFTIIPGDADYHAEKVDIITPAGAEVNYITLTGNLTGVKVQAGSKDMTDIRDLFTVPQGYRFFYGSTVKTAAGSIFRIPFTTEYGTPAGFNGDINLPLSGEKRIHEVGLYHVEPLIGKPSGRIHTISEYRGSLGERYDFALRALNSRDERRLSLASTRNTRSARTKINIGAFKRLNIFSEPFDRATGVTSVTFSLPLRTENIEDMLYIRIHDPAVPSRLWNQFALNLKGFDGDFKILELTVDFTDIVLTGGDRLWIDIGSAGKCEIELGNTDNPAEMTVSSVAPYIAVDAYAEKEIISAKAQYSKMYEYMPWKFSGEQVSLEQPYAYGGPFDILYPALAIKRVKPNHFVSNFMEIMSGPFYSNSGSPSDISKIELKTIIEPNEAPDWAVYMRDYNTFRYKICDWWFERQNSDGQIGGGWNDDTLFMSAHMPDLPLDGNTKARAIIDSVHTKIENTRLFEDGYCRIYPIDRMHTGDFISERYNTVINNLGQAYAAEREMESAYYSGHFERTPLNYGEGRAFLSSVNVLNWYWGVDVPEKPYVSKLLDELTEDLRLFASCQNEYTFHRYTASNVHRDDFRPYGSPQVYQYLLGGRQGSRLDVHPEIAVMWPSGGGKDVARVILKADDTSLEAVCYSFFDVKRDLEMRLCRIEDGRYNIAIHADPDGTGQAGTILWQTEKDIRRFDMVTLPIPPKTPIVIRVRQIQKHDRPSEMPDLAVDPWDARYSDGNVFVTVHNIGNAAAENIAVRLVDGDNTVESKMIASLVSAVNFKPVKEEVTFSNVVDSGNLKIIVDPENAITEILEDNNQVTVKGQ